MSYLDSLRMHFSGRFLADVSTINNHPGHYDNAAFNRAQHWLSGSGGSVSHGWWHPDGTHRFRFNDVVVRKAMLKDGTDVPASDPIHALTVESRGTRAAKMADLDPDQQMVSMIFGLKIALSNDDTGDIAMEADCEPAPFSDIWRRGLSGSGDEAACVFYQSVLHVTSWGDVSGSPFLQELKAAATDLLSIKFNLDGYSMNSSSLGFATGRIVGTIGPAANSEPKHWTVGRNLGAEVFPPGIASPGFRPSSGINYCVAVHDKARNKIRIDLGNALPVNPAGGPIPDFGKLTLGVHKSDGNVEEIAEIEYDQGDWYERTAGIVEVPADRDLTADETQSINESALCILVDDNGQPAIVIEEPQTHVRADMFVARMNPGDPFVARFRATTLGKPIPNATINVFLLVPSGTGTTFPAAGLSFPSSVTCDANGQAEITFTAADPGNPRFFYSGGTRVHVDGQVYRLGYQLAVGGEDIPTANPSDHFSVLVWNAFASDDPPTWHGSMKKIFTQYGNLYPWMTKFGPKLDLADYAQVSAARDDIIEVLSFAETDSRYMPVTRDLSAARKAAMLKWLSNVGADGKLLLGTAPAPGPAPASTPEAAVAAPIVVGGLRMAELGGKSLAALRTPLVRYEPEGKEAH